MAQSFQAIRSPGAIGEIMPDRRKRREDAYGPASAPARECTIGKGECRVLLTDGQYFSDSHARLAIHDQGGLA